MLGQIRKHHRFAPLGQIGGGGAERHAVLAEPARRQIQAVRRLPVADHQIEPLLHQLHLAIAERQ
ncbi:hypothetical protein D3C85_1624950 [compost metagenome]